MEKISILFWFLSLLCISCQSSENLKYVCPPCGQSCDTLFFAEAGICPHCEMELVLKDQMKKETQLSVNQIKIEEGAGVFLVDGGPVHRAKKIKVHYYRPRNFDKNSRILLVIPGAGRNGDSYRDDWVDYAEKYSVLILSPAFSKTFYSFEDYHLGGVVKHSNFVEIAKYVEGSNEVIIDETEIHYDINSNQDSWIFNDFDRIFDLVVHQLKSSQVKYDLFGHSAGGQILHRLAILNASKKVGRIIAANSGFYTLPSEDFKYPFGIQDKGILKQEIAHTFSQKLTVLVGELDNENENRGTLLRSESADIQGEHRLARAKFFFNYAKDLALKNKETFNWNIEIVPGVGHDHTGMAKAAARILYGSF